MQADVFSRVDGASILDKGIRVDVSGHKETIAKGGIYMGLNALLAMSGAHEAVKTKIEDRISNKWARIAAVQLTRAGIDSTAVVASSLYHKGTHSFTLKSEGKRYTATTVVNFALFAAEELAQKNSMTKSIVESEVYQFVVRPAAQFVGANFVLNLFNSASGNGTPGTP